MRVFAEWFVTELPEDMDEFHISCGPSDGEQWVGFFPSVKGATLHIERVCEMDGHSGYNVRFTAPSQGLEKHKGYWLSPNTVGDDEGGDFGIK